METGRARIRRIAFERFGSARYSRPSLNCIDRKLEKYLPERGGFFIEAGANDGFSQSNTYYLEKLRGWKGILVEPVPLLYEACVRERRRSTVFNCALVSADFPEPTIAMWYANLMSVVTGARGSDECDLDHVKLGEQVQPGVRRYRLTVPARTMSSLLDEVGVEKVDLFCLDVEGYELAALSGLDLRRHRPRFILVETNFRSGVEQYLNGIYEPIDELSEHDVLYRLTSGC